jgi:hypothetical protein
MTFSSLKRHSSVHKLHNPTKQHLGNDAQHPRDCSSSPYHHLTQKSIQVH